MAKYVHIFGQVSAHTLLEDLKEGVQASHNQTKQGSQPHDGFQLLVHHLKYEFLCFLDIHLVDALTNDLADVDGFKSSWKMFADNSAVDGLRGIHGLVQLLIVTFE